MKNIIIEGAREKNLKNINVEIPRNKIVLLTGVSGSGKSSLAMDVLYQECQRQYLEAIAFQGIAKPDVDAVRNACAAIQISQRNHHRNPRSSVGTQTNIYTDLRMIYEKLGKRTCPHCHQEIFAHHCKEEVVKNGNDFEVYMYCEKCNHRMRKMTRTYFSYNTKDGACKTCEGMGTTLSLRKEKVLHEDLSLEDGAVDFWEQAYKNYQIQAYYKACDFFKCPIKKGTRLKDFTPLQKAILEEGVQSDKVKNLLENLELPKNVANGKFEGVYTTLFRRVHENGGVAQHQAIYFQEEECSTCHGERLQEESRNITVMDTRLPELVTVSLEELFEWILKLEDYLLKEEREIVLSYLLDLKTKLKRIIKAGLGYLHINRQTMTLSGGETQRILLAAALDSDLTGMLYILDEPTIGLHPKDTEGIIEILKELRDKGNTILVIEHDQDVMKAADWIIDIGPCAGVNGGMVVGEGTYDELLLQPDSITGMYLKNQNHSIISNHKQSNDFLKVRHAMMHNLKDIDVEFPIGCLTCVTGVSGSGKSTLVFDVLAKGNTQGNKNLVEGLSTFQHQILIEQAPLTRMKRSNVATYVQLYTEIRKLFGNLNSAIDQGFTMKDFSFNTKGGRCENCEGLGYVTSNMLFFEDIDIQCPVCKGKQFHDELLTIKYQGYSIHDVLQMSIERACELFQDQHKIMKILSLLNDVGLGYLTLGQSLTTLSNGEGQRLKLARELLEHRNEHNLYLIDEPTTGLHPLDVEHFLVLLHRLVEEGNTVIVVEHNVQVIRASDWIIDLGLEGGIHGGNVIAKGTLEDIKQHPDSVTGRYL